MTVQHLRPRGFSELIDATFAILKAHFRTLATGAALIMVPVMAFSLVMAAAMPETTLAAVAAEAAGGPRATPSDPSGVAIALALLLFPVAVAAYVGGFAALVHMASQAYLGERVDLPGALREARRRFWSLLGATIAKYLGAALIMMLPAILLPLLVARGGSAPNGGLVVAAALLMPVGLIVALVLVLRWAVTTPLVMLEGVGAGAALGRSARLTHGHKWRLFGIAVVLVVLLWVAMLTMMSVGMVVVRSPMVAQVLSNLLSLVTYPFGAVLLTVIYYDLRIRGEGYDLEVMASGLDGSLPAAAARGTQQPA